MQTSSFFSAYASLAGSMMLIRSMGNDMNLMIPGAIRDYIQSAIHYLFAPLSTKLTIVIDEQCGMNGNQVYEAADVYLRTRISPKAERFKVYKTPKQRILNTSIAKDEVVVDTFQGCQLSWTLVTVEQNKFSAEKRFFELSFDKKFKEQVLTDYLPFVLAKAKEIKDSDRVVKLYTRDCPYYSDDDGNYGGGGGVWGAISLDHPSTFETLAMDPEMKKAIIDDLDRFLKRREFYKKVGKAWKRGYLLYGPPGTGKSSLIAAMANYLKFDVYDLELTSLYSNSELRRILISTTNRSIIVIEDIDCSVEMHDREKENHDPPSSNSKFTLSGLLNFIDGLWSSCGDERIIVFTTNHKDRLDPALLRPGRMDMHIHMSYLTPGGFRLLASNYFDVGDQHKLFGEIEGLIKNIQVTPAEIAEELLRSEDTDNALAGVVNLLKRKRIESEETNQEKTNEFGVLEGSPDAKRVKKEENLKRVRALRSNKGMRVIEGRGGRGKGRGRRR